MVWGFQDVVSAKKVMAVANLSGNEQTVTDVPWLDEGDWHNIFDQSILTVSGKVVDNMTLPAYTAWVFSNVPDSSLLPIENSKQNLPIRFAVSQNFPNPFNPNTTIKFDLPQQEYIRMEIFNILGQRVRMLVGDMYPAGSYQIWWDGKNDEGILLGSGIYILYFNAGDFVQKRRMVLLK